MSAAAEEDEWEYHAFRVGRTTRSATRRVGRWATND